MEAGLPDQAVSSRESPSTHDQDCPRVHWPARSAPARDASVTPVDRLTETGVMQGLLDEVRAGSSGVLVLRGRVGMGKTALLREVAERAAKGGMRVAQAAGIQAELEFDFAGLHQLLLPFAGGLRDLPDPQRAALGTVFG